ncbi:MAG: tetratricopeptide repeat protein, partial [Rhodospirillaceae bacterium]
MNRRDRRSRAANPDAAVRAEALFRAATEHLRAGRLDAACAAYRDTLRLVPDSANAHGMLATCLHDGGDRAAAGVHFRRAAALAPGDAAHQRNLGMWLLDSGDKPAAIDAFRRAVANAPDDAELRRTLGTLLADLGRYDEAAPQLRRVIERSPGDVAARRALALVKRDTGDLRGAEDMMRPLLDLPDPPPGLHTDFAALLRDTDRDEEAIGLLDACLAKYPDYREARFHRGMVRLRRRNFADGWADYARGLRPTDPSPDFSTEPVPADLTGRRVRIDRDQGLGDEIFFLRFAPEIARRGARVVYRGDARLTAMFARLDFVAETMAIGADAGACDIAWCASH